MMDGRVRRAGHALRGGAVGGVEPEESVLDTRWIDALLHERNLRKQTNQTTHHTEMQV